MTRAFIPSVRDYICPLRETFQPPTNMAVLFISHDLLLVASLCRRVAILDNGEIVESGPAATIFSSPEHPYTRAYYVPFPQKAPISSSEVASRSPNWRIPDWSQYHRHWPAGSEIVGIADSRIFMGLLRLKSHNRLSGL